MWKKIAKTLKVKLSIINPEVNVTNIHQHLKATKNSIAQVQNLQVHNYIPNPIPNATNKIIEFQNTFRGTFSRL